MSKILRKLFPGLISIDTRVSEDARFILKQIADFRDQLNHYESKLSAERLSHKRRICLELLDDLETLVIIKRKQNKSVTFELYFYIYGEITALIDLVRHYNAPQGLGVQLLQHMESTSVDSNDRQAWESAARKFVHETIMNTQPWTPETIGGHAKRIAHEVYGFMLQQKRQAT